MRPGVKPAMSAKRTVVSGRPPRSLLSMLEPCGDRGGYRVHRQLVGPLPPPPGDGVGGPQEQEDDASGSATSLTHPTTRSWYGPAPKVARQPSGTIATRPTRNAQHQGTARRGPSARIA